LLGGQSPPTSSQLSDSRDSLDMRAHAKGSLWMWKNDETTCSVINLESPDQCDPLLIVFNVEKDRMVRECRLSEFLSELRPVFSRERNVHQLKIGEESMVRMNQVIEDLNSILESNDSGNK